MAPPDPQQIQALIDEGLARHRAGDGPAAVAAFRQAHALAPQSGEIAGTLGALLLEIKNAAAALPYLEHAVALQPSSLKGHVNLGAALRQMGRADEARSAFERALAINPNFDMALVGLGRLRQVAGDAAGALKYYERAAAANPNAAEGYYRLGTLAVDRLDDLAAIPFFERALALRPADARWLMAAGVANTMAGRFSEARQCFQHFAQTNSKDVGLWANYLMALNYDPALSVQQIFDQHRRFQALLPSPPGPAPFEPRLRSGRKLRVGYVSADFRGQACANFLYPIARAHDRSRLEIILYAGNSRTDAVTDRFRAICDLWRPIQDLDDAAAAALIQNDRVDILVDCAGHTNGNRIGLMARRPAPVSVTFLGYPNTTGLTSVDYRLTDAVADPVGEANDFATERLVRLPHGFLTFAPLIHVPLPSPPPRVARGYVTFGSFNNRAKINDAVLAAWAQILKAVPGSRLLLKDRRFGAPAAAGQVRGVLVAHGADAANIEIRGHVEHLEDHYAMYADMDIALDPFPYNGTTTTCDALWMGVPVVALRGDRHAARVSASLLTQVGLPELVAEDIPSYVRVAAGLAADTEKIAQLRQSLRGMVQGLPLGTPSVVTRDIEDFYFSAAADAGL